MVFFVIHVVAFEAGLSDVLSFEEFEFLSHVNEIGGSVEREVKIVSPEDVIDVEGLDFI